MEELAVTEYKFTGQRVATRGIVESLPDGLAIFIWDLIEERKTDKDFVMDYLQVFELSVVDGLQVIRHFQEQSEPYEAFHYPIGQPLTSGKIYIIDDYFHVTMLWSFEY